MRLIDADALKEWIQILPNSTYKDTVLNAVDDMPTADTDMSGYSDRLWKLAYEQGKTNAVRRGRWIETEENHGFDNEVRNKALSCSVCRVAFRISDYAQIEDFRYCPECGARMDEE